MLITWWRKRTVSALRKIEFRSSWQHGGFFELAAICSGVVDGNDDDHVDGGDDDHVDGNDGTNYVFTLNGLKKQDISISSCSVYSSSASTMRNTRLGKTMLIVVVA